MGQMSWLFVYFYNLCFLSQKKTNFILKLNEHGGGLMSDGVLPLAAGKSKVAMKSRHLAHMTSKVDLEVDE